MLTQKNLFIYPTDIVQNPAQSIVNNGYYDFSDFSAHEVNVINSVIHNAESKYRFPLLGLGFYNEVEPTMYKPRYILLELIIRKFSSSHNPLDLFAVSKAYRAKGALFYNKSVEYYEKFLFSITPELIEAGEKNFVFFSEPFRSYSTAELYMKIGQYELALEYALTAFSKNYMRAPGYPLLVGQLYRRIDATLAIQYFEDLFMDPYWSSYKSYFQKEYELSLSAHMRKKPFKRRPYKPTAHDLQFQGLVEEATNDFLPGGRYYSDK